MADAAPADAEGSTTNTADVEALRAALAAARAEAAARADALEVAKARAKAIVRKQTEVARAEGERMERKAEEQRGEIETLVKRVKELEAERTKEKRKVNGVKAGEKEAKPAPGSTTKEGGKGAADRIEEALARLRRVAEIGVKPKGESDANGAADGEETPDRESAPDGDAAASEAHSKIAPELLEIAHDLSGVGASVRALADDLLAAQTAATMLEEDGRAQVATSQRMLAEARAESQALRSRVTTLQSSQKARAGSISQTAELKAALDAKATLEAKVSSMDVLLTEKNSEVLKVREKAREFLKNMSADKRTMETKLREEIKALKQAVAALDGKAREGEKHAQTLDAELENCLALVSEKQKTIQMLNMTLSTEKEAAAKIGQEGAAIRQEFAKYKGRARVALEERDGRLAGQDKAVAEATDSLRTQLEKAMIALEEEREKVAASKEQNAGAKALLDRATRAEIALDLERTSADTESGVHAAKLKKLGQSVEAAEQRAGEYKTLAEETEERVAALSERMTSATKAAAAAEARLLEQEKESVLEVTSLREKISFLEASLHKSVESASAAQRVAAVAARALGSPSAPNTPRRTSPRAPSRAGVLPLLAADDALAGVGSSSLAGVMASHALGAGLGAVDDAAPAGGDDAFRNQQMGVLVSQLSELSTLLDDAQEETKARQLQTDVLKREVRELERKLAAADRLQGGTPFNYMRTIVVRFLETNDANLLPVIAEVLKFSEGEMRAIRRGRGEGEGRQAAGLFSAFLGRG